MLAQWAVTAYQKCVTVITFKGFQAHDSKNVHRAEAGAQARLQTNLGGAKVCNCRKIDLPTLARRRTAARLSRRRGALFVQK